MKRSQNEVHSSALRSKEETEEDLDQISGSVTDSQEEYDLEEGSYDTEDYEEEVEQAEKKRRRKKANTSFDSAFTHDNSEIQYQIQDEEN
jgi:hypothetical protein